MFRKSTDLRLAVSVFMVFEFLFKPMLRPIIHSFGFFNDEVFITYSWLYILTYGAITTLLFGVLVLLIITLLPVILRLIYDVRRVATKKEKQRLIPLFNAVKKVYEEPGADLSTKLYIEDTSSIKAYAFEGTIVLSRGAMQFFSDKELTGVIAHEFSHINNDDTKFVLYIAMFSNVYFIILVLINFLFNVIIHLLGNKSFLAAILKILVLPVKLVFYILELAINLLIGQRQQKQEYQADYTAYEKGLGEELLQALYKLYDIQISDTKKALDRYSNTHPRLAYRIEKLEDYLK